MKFRNKCYDVKAIQFNGDNFGEIEEICAVMPLTPDQARLLFRHYKSSLEGKEVPVTEDGKYCLVFEKTGPRGCPVSLNDWIVRFDGRVWTMHPDEFEKTYAAIR